MQPFPLQAMTSMTLPKKRSIEAQQAQVDGGGDDTKALDEACSELKRLKVDETKQLCCNCCHYLVHDYNFGYCAQCYDEPLCWGWYDGPGHPPKWQWCLSACDRCYTVLCRQCKHKHDTEGCGDWVAWECHAGNPQ